MRKCAIHYFAGCKIKMVQGQDVVQDQNVASLKWCKIKIWCKMKMVQGQDMVQDGHGARKLQYEAPNAPAAPPQKNNEQVLKIQSKSHSQACMLMRTV
mmetsp:Transcript_21460/g.59444  ORF Transcript_21460/g.59444 Transcript_21460/m.59444 type:complete len:98 (-) Transcript_21460:286-579(-)